MFPGLGGELGILPGHTPLISQLQTGVLSYTTGGKTFNYTSPAASLKSGMIMCLC